MADNKRNSIAGKVATPKSIGVSGGNAQTSTSSDTLDALIKAVGARLKVTTTGPLAQTVEGTLFTADPVLNLVAVNVRNPPPNPASNVAAQPGDYRVFPVSRIQSFQIISPAAQGEAGFANAPPTIGPVDTKRLIQREADRVRKVKEDEQSKGKGVTAEGQAIFDSFKRINTPIRWHNQEMIVHDAVIISPPYTVDNCRGAKDKQETLNRVKKVLEGERRKIKEKEDRERNNGAPRKGG